MKYLLLLFCGSLVAQGQPQAPSPAEALSSLTKEQLLEVIKLLSQQQQQKTAPAIVPTPVVVATPLAMPAMTSMTPGEECAHFVLDMIGQVVTVAVAQDPVVTVHGVTNIAHQLVSRIVQQHQQKRTIAITDENNDDVTRYELLKHILEELEGLMEELRNLDLQGT